MPDLPVPRNSEQQFLSGICDRLDRQNTLLADICDRLPVPAEQPVAEPEGNAGAPETVELIEPAKAAPSRRAPAKKTPAARSAASKKES